MAEYVTHTLEPLYDGESRVLILGTQPSPKSRAVGVYYYHPQNPVWRVLADVFQSVIHCDIPPILKSTAARRLPYILCKLRAGATFCLS